jgi:DNA polymerase-4
MNNFYASVECMLNPSLRDKAVAVCGSVEERHGIVLAKNYAAKAFGFQPGRQSGRRNRNVRTSLLLNLITKQYMKFSRKAREIYGRYTDLIEPYGMDECWLDVTGSGQWETVLKSQTRSAGRSPLSLALRSRQG